MVTYEQHQHILNVKELLKSSGENIFENRLTEQIKEKLNTDISKELLDFKYQ